MLRDDVTSVAGPALAVLLLSGVLAATPLVEPLRRLAADALLRASATYPPADMTGAPGVAIVAIDAQSLRAFPDWPWPRELYADAIERLTDAGVASIAFDIDFSTPRDPEGDAALADAISRSGRVALAAFRQVQVLEGGAELEVANVPMPLLADRAAAIGSVLMPVDSDGVVRRGTRRSEIGGEPVPPLAAVALDVAGGRVTPRRPADAEGTFAVDYRRRLPPIPEIPIVDVIEGRFDARSVRGRVVFVGASAAEFQDLWSTPIGPARPGVWIQAVSARTLAAERAGAPVLRRVPASGVVGATLVCVALLASFARLGGGRRLALLALLGAALVACVFVLLVRTGLLLDPVVPLCAMGAQHVLGLERVRARLGRLVRERERSLDALSEVGLAATASPSPLGADPLSIALALLGDVVDARAVALLRAEPDGSLEGRRIDWLRHDGARPAGDLERAREALRDRETRVVPGDDRLSVYAPLCAGDTPVGVLVVERAGRDPLEPSHLRTIATVGTQITLSAENLRLIEGLRDTFDSAVEAIASAVEARDGYTELHCRRLAVFSVMMAERLGVDADEVEAIRLGALLHDVGKIGIRDEVLLKPGRFDAEERAEMERHAALGHRIVMPIHGLTATTAACVRHHHERWDGTGYPDGLAGEQIPLGARIVSVVDVWDALSTARPYKKAYSEEKVRELLMKGRGTSFDPDLVDLFLDVLDEQGEEMLALTRAGSES